MRNNPEIGRGLFSPVELQLVAAGGEERALRAELRATAANVLGDAPEHKSGLINRDRVEAHLLLRRGGIARLAAPEHPRGQTQSDRLGQLVEQLGLIVAECMRGHDERHPPAVARSPQPADELACLDPGRRALPHPHRDSDRMGDGHGRPLRAWIEGLCLSEEVCHELLQTQPAVKQRDGPGSGSSRGDAFRAPMLAVQTCCVRGSLRLNVGHERVRRTPL